tara:strand:- start:70 stop:318 length:249 start_codon:yes stop_codon:yes gene_type:complete
MEEILKQYGFVQSAIPNQFNWYNRNKAILWDSAEDGNYVVEYVGVTLLKYSPNVGRLLSSIDIIGEVALVEYFEKNNWVKVR